MTMGERAQNSITCRTVATAIMFFSGREIIISTLSAAAVMAANSSSAVSLEEGDGKNSVAFVSAFTGPPANFAASANAKYSTPLPV